MRKSFYSFRFAFAGIAHLLRTQRNARSHLAISLAVIAAGLGFKITRTDWLWLLVAATMVFSAEAFNTAIEILADRLTLDRDEKIRRAKDVAAAAVLFTAVGAAGIGFAIFGPYCLAVVCPT